MLVGPGTIPEEVPTLSYWCFEPGVAMRSLESLKVRCILLTSGTLSPMDSFAQELQLDFPISLENPHVIADTQACLIPSSCPLLSFRHALNSSHNAQPLRDYRNHLRMSAFYSCSMHSAAQVWVGMARLGLSSKAMNSNCNTQDAAGYKKDLRMALAN